MFWKTPFVGKCKKLSDFFENQIVFALFHMKNKLFGFSGLNCSHAGKFFSVFIWQELFDFNGFR